MKAETNYNTDYSKNALFEKRAKLYSRHSTGNRAVQVTAR